MPKKKKSPAKKRPVKSVDHKEEFLLTLIKYSEAAVGAQGGDIDNLFTAQAARLKNELAIYKASK